MKIIRKSRKIRCAENEEAAFTFLKHTTSICKTLGNVHSKHKLESYLHKGLQHGHCELKLQDSKFTQMGFRVRSSQGLKTYQPIKKLTWALCEAIQNTEPLDKNKLLFLIFLYSNSPF